MDPVLLIFLRNILSFAAMKLNIETHSCIIENVSLYEGAGSLSRNQPAWPSTQKSDIAFSDSAKVYEQIFDISINFFS